MNKENGPSFLAWSRDNQARFAAEMSDKFEAKADLNSPRFTGLPTAPTAEPGTNNEQIATTAFVIESLSHAGDGGQDKVSKAGDTMTGDLVITKADSSARITLRRNSDNTGGWIKNDGYGLRFGVVSSSNNFSEVLYFGSYGLSGTSSATLGRPTSKWANVYTKKLNNGADIAIPEKEGTLALLSDIPDIDANNYVSKSGDTMTGDLTIGGDSSDSKRLQLIRLSGTTPIGGFITDNGQGLTFGSYNSGIRGNLYAMSNGPTLGFYPLKSNMFTLGNSLYKWTGVFAAKLNNGADIEIPNKAGTLALLSDIEDILKQHGLI